MVVISNGSKIGIPAGETFEQALTKVLSELGEAHSRGDSKLVARILSGFNASDRKRLDDALTTWLGKAPTQPIEIKSTELRAEPRFQKWVREYSPAFARTCERVEIKVLVPPAAEAPRLKDASLPKRPRGDAPQAIRD
jgi:hypothetical protein